VRTVFGKRESTSEALLIGTYGRWQQAKAEMAIDGMNESTNEDRRRFGDERKDKQVS
jgi:hypothetical protein